MDKIYMVMDLLEFNYHQASTVFELGRIHFYYHHQLPPRVQKVKI